MLVTLEGMVMLPKLVQFWKAQVPILVTLEGMVMLVRPAQALNAKLPMLVTGSPTMFVGISTTPTAVVG